MSDVLGRPTEYDPDFCVEVAELCQNGATDEEVADYLGVSARTVYRWQNKYPEFCQALKAGKEVADERVVRSLYHRATGYTFDAVKILVVDKEVQQVPYKEHVPPDTTAAIFWLKNRRPAEWREKSETSATVKIEHTRKLDISTLSDEQLDALEGALRATVAQLGGPVIEHED